MTQSFFGYKDLKGAALELGRNVPIFGRLGRSASVSMEIRYVMSAQDKTLSFEAVSRAGNSIAESIQRAHISKTQKLLREE